MKSLVASLLAIAFVYTVIGLAEAGIFVKILTHLKSTGSGGPGQIAWPTFMILLAAGLIGILGIRRKGKKS